ncbi:MAG: hypothetical protein HW377_2014 [Actinobacteria bacterium]|nr:hypothetical protein [Actinomycetota bacterium]
MLDGRVTRGTETRISDTKKVNRVDMKALFHYKTTLSMYLAVLTVFSLTILPACAGGGHCRNLMDPDFTEIGAGYAIGPFGGNPAARYWTFDLADR